MSEPSPQEHEHCEQSAGPVALAAHGRSRASLLALLDAASVSPNASQYLPSLSVVFEAVANGRVRVGDELADASLVPRLVLAAHDELPSIWAEEDFLPHDPRFDVQVEWAGEMFRIPAVSLERPTSKIETLRRLSASIDSVLHEHTEYGLADVVELILRRVDAVTSALAPAWPADLGQVLHSPPLLSPEELAVAVGLPSLEHQLAQCSDPARAHAALLAHSAPPGAFRRNGAFTPATFGSTIAIRHDQTGFTPLPTGLMIESLNALAGQLAPKALALDPSLDYQWLTATWRYIGGLLDAAGLNVLGPLSDDQYPLLHSVIRYSDSQYLAVSVVGGLDPQVLQERTEAAAIHLDTVAAGSTLAGVKGTVSIPATAQLCRLLIVAQPQDAMIYIPAGAKCALMTLEDLDWIRRTIGRDEIDLWYFVRDRVEQPRIGQLRSWDGVDLWEAWRDHGRSFYRGARTIDLLSVEPHYSLREWQNAAEQRDIDEALSVLDMGRVSAWPWHSLDGDSKLVGNIRAGVLYRLVVCETPIAVALYAGSGGEQRFGLARNLGNCMAYKLECVTACLVDLMQSAGLPSLRIEIAHIDGNQDSPIQMTATGDGVLVVGCASNLEELLHEDPRSVEAQLGALLADAVAGEAAPEGFIAAWNDAPPGIRVDVIAVGPKVQRTLGAHPLHDSHRSARLMELGEHLEAIGTEPGTYEGDDAKQLETDTIYPWLIERLHEELSSFDRDGVFRFALTQLERTNCQRWWSTEETAYEAGTPSEGEARLPESGQDLLYQSRFIALLIEEVLARPPNGDRTPTEYEWQELLSFATLAGESSTRSEVLHRELASPALAVTDLYQVIIDETDIGMSIDLDSFSRDARLAGLPDPVPIDSADKSQEWEQEWQPISIRLPEYADIDLSLQDSLGFGIDAILGILDTIIRWPVSEAHCTDLVTLRQLAEDATSANSEISMEVYETAAKWLSLGGEDFASSESMIRHWEVESRSARVAIRPLIRDASRAWVLPWTAEIAKRAWATYLSQHRLPVPDEELPAPVAAAFASARDKRSREFEEDCAARLNGLPLRTYPRVREHRAHKHGIAHLTGEIDLLCIVSERSHIFVIEAKDLFAPLSTRSMHRQINQFHAPGGYVDKLDRKVQDISASAQTLAANKESTGPTENGGWLA